MTASTAAPPGKPRGAFHHGSLRTAATEAALEMVRAGGPAALGLRQVAQAAGVNHRALYRHFRDRDGLAMAVASIGFGLLADRIEMAGAGAPSAGPAAAMAAYVDFALAEPGLYALMFGIRGNAYLDGPDVSVAVGRVTDLVAEAFRRPTDPPGYSVILRDRVIAAWGSAHGLIDLWTRGALRARDAAEARRYIVDLLAQSLGDKGPA